MSNLIDQYFPKKHNDDKDMAESICLVRHFYGMSYEEVMETEIPEFIILRDYAAKEKAQQEAIFNALAGIKKRR